MINYLVSLTAVSAYGSGVSSFISDHLKISEVFGGARVVIIDYCKGEYKPVIDFDCEVRIYDKDDLEFLNLDGFWYTHDYPESKLLHEHGIEHLVQFHHGDLLIEGRVDCMRELLSIRDSQETEHELEILRGPYANLVVQTPAIAEKFNKLGIKNMVARPILRERTLTEEKCYDLCITASLAPFKALAVAIASVRNVPNKRIAVIASTPGQCGGDLDVESLSMCLGRLGIGNVENTLRSIDWFFGIERDEVNEIIASSKRVLHPSLVEAYPMVVLEASQYTTVLTNKCASYSEHLDYEVQPIDVTNPAEIFGPVKAAAIDVTKHNELGSEEWKNIAKLLLK